MITRFLLADLGFMRGHTCMHRAYRARHPGTIQPNSRTANSAGHETPSYPLHRANERAKVPSAFKRDEGVL